MNKEELQEELAHVQQALNQATAIIQWMETSKFWKLRLAWIQLREKIKLPRYRLTHPSKPSFTPFAFLSRKNEYALWQQHNTPRPVDLKKLAETIEIFPYRPLISVVMPVFNTPEEFLKEAIESVRSQIYPHWELCIADDASTLTHVRQLLEHYQAQDSRIRVKLRTTNGHISNCSNSALELATGEFVALLDHDDILTPDALYEVALLINRQPMVDMIYSDEDKVDEHGNLKEPFFKPDWCPDSFLSRMYICHLGVYRRSILQEIGGFRTGYEGSQDYDLVLRFTEKTEHIFHLPKILYHWRIHPASVAKSGDAKPYAYQAAEKALTDAIYRRQEPGKVTGVPGCLGHYIVRYHVSDQKLVSIIISTKNRGDILSKCLESIFAKSTYPNYEVILVNNSDIEESTAEVSQQWSKRESDRFSSYILDIPFNHSQINNYAASKAKGEFLLFLSDDTEVITPDWMEAMVEQAQRVSIGAVGTLLIYPDYTIHHAGVVLGIRGIAGHSHRRITSETPGYFGQVVCASNFSSVSGSCLMCKKQVFKSIGGFNEKLGLAYNDIDICLKMVEKGLKNIYLPHVVLCRHAPESNGDDSVLNKRSGDGEEISYMLHRWKSFIDNDPCYSPHLTRNREDYSLNL